MKCRSAATTTKDERISVSDEEGHTLGLRIEEGLAFFENGEIARIRYHTIYDSISGKGSQAIGAGGYAFGSMLIHPKEAMGQSIEGYLEKVPMETRWDLISGAFIYNTVNYFKGLYDQGGKEKFVEFMKQQGQRARAGYKGLTDRLRFTGNDAKSAVAIIPTIVGLYFGPQQKFEIEEATMEKARVKCINCAFWNATQAMKISDDLCSPWSQYTWDGRAKAINSNLTSNLVKARPRGDSVCEWVIELKT